MKTRRGSSFWPTTLSGATMVNQYHPGDIVTSSLAKQSDFIGVVRGVDPKINKVWVAWAGGVLAQHDPDEIHFEPHQSEIVRSRMASRRPFVAADPATDPQYVGDPSAHGIDKPIGGGFSIMQNLVKDQRQEMTEESKGGQPKMGCLRSRRAMYWSSPERIYRLTKREIVDSAALCPKCREKMTLEPYTKNDRMYCCPICKFKIPRSNVIVASMRSRRIKTAGPGVAPDVLFRRVRAALLKIAKDISAAFPSANLKYRNWAISGAVEGHQVEVFFNIIRASNAEVAGLPALVVDGKSYGGHDIGFDIPKELAKVIAPGKQS